MYASKKIRIGYNLLVTVFEKCEEMLQSVAGGRLIDYHHRVWGDPKIFPASTCSQETISATSLLLVSPFSRPRARV